MARLLIVLTALVALHGCATAPPRDIGNSCAIFEENPRWYRAVKASHEKWGVPPHLQLAFIHQESSFRAKARPERRYLLGFFPWRRPSTAYGYAQAKDETWAWYQERTGNRRARRTNFADATDFIGWYVSLSHEQLGLSKWDVRQQYLAYHEGMGGYRRGTYRQKPWLIDVSQRVEHNANRYRAQLGYCREQLDSRRRWLPF